MMTVEDIATVVGPIVSRYDVGAAYLFGSYARGEADVASDIDVRLECGDSIRFSDILDIQDQLEKALGSRIELITNPLRFMRTAFRERIQKDEVLLYEAA